MLDHELFLFGSEQIAGPWRESWCGHGGLLFPRIVESRRGRALVHYAHFWRRCSIPPGTPLTFSCFLHNHHPANMKPSSVKDPWSAAEVPLVCLKKGPGCLTIPFVPMNESSVVISAFLRQTQLHSGYF